MIGNALILTIAVLLALSFWLMGELKFLIPYKVVLIHAYGTPVFIFLVVLFTNLFAAAVRTQPQILPQGHRQKTFASRQANASRPGGVARTFHRHHRWK